MKPETRNRIIEVTAESSAFITGLSVAIGVCSVPASMLIAICPSKIGKVAIGVGASIAGGFLGVYVSDKVLDSNREIIESLADCIDNLKPEKKTKEVIE